MRILNLEIEKELFKDFQTIHELLLKYGEVIYESGLVKKDADPKKSPHTEYIFTLTINPNKK